MVPDPPQTSMFHLHLNVPEGDLKANMLGLAEEEGIWTWRGTFPSTHPDWQIVELTVGDSTLDFEPDEARRLIARLVSS